MLLVQQIIVMLDSALLNVNLRNGTGIIYNTSAPQATAAALLL